MLEAASRALVQGRCKLAEQAKDLVERDTGKESIIVVDPELVYEEFEIVLWENRQAKYREVVGLLACRLGMVPRAFEEKYPGVAKYIG